TLYGDRYAEFLDRVQAYAYFPYVVAKDVADFRDGEISVRFEGISGRIDQGARILFNLKPNGDYLTVRANPLENNLVLWKFEKGKRSSVKWIRNTPTPTRQWHDLKVHIAGPKITAYLDGKRYLEHVLPEPVSGRIGLWSKADSHMYFDDFTVTPADCAEVQHPNSERGAACHLCAARAGPPAEVAGIGREIALALLRHRRDQPLEKAVDGVVVDPAHDRDKVVLGIDIDHIEPVAIVHKGGARRTWPLFAIGVEEIVDES